MGRPLLAAGVVNPAATDDRLLAIAVMRAILQGDSVAADLLLADADFRSLALVLTGMVRALLAASAGDDWAAVLDAWTAAAVTDAAG